MTSKGTETSWLTRQPLKSHTAEREKSSNSLIMRETDSSKKKVQAAESPLSTAATNTHTGTADTKAVLSLSTLMARCASVVALCVSLFKDYVKHCGVLLSTAAVVAMACSLRGDMLLVAMVTYKTFLGNYQHNNPPNPNPNDTQLNTNETITQGHDPVRVSDYKPVLPEYLQLPDEYNLKDLLYFIVIAVGSSIVMYHLVCGYLQIYFYTLKRSEPEKWKCQPHRFLTRSNELHEVVVGTMNLVLASSVSGCIVCWIMNGNHSTVYFGLDEYGYVYLLLSVVFLFFWFEGGAFYSHALLHMPLLYKTVHKHHHRYHSPTAYSAVAMSPFEMVFYQSIFLSPVFLFPINGLVYISLLVYVYYFSLIDHSGVKMVSVFPWQPNTMFHDDHHKYFHCNFGFNSYLFDWLHGTLRRKDRMYGEEVFWGRGRERGKRDE